MLELLLREQCSSDEEYEFHRLFKVLADRIEGQVRLVREHYPREHQLHAPT